MFQFWLKQFEVSNLAVGSEGRKDEHHQFMDVNISLDISIMQCFGLLINAHSKHFRCAAINNHFSLSSSHGTVKGEEIAMKL